MLISSSPVCIFKVITLTLYQEIVLCSTSFNSFSKVKASFLHLNTFLCLILPNFVFISCCISQLLSWPWRWPYVAMSCGPSMLPSGHRALCSRLSLCGLCALLLWQDWYCRCAGRWGWPLAHGFWGCALCNELYPRVGLPRDYVWPDTYRVAAGPLVGGPGPLALIGCENSKWCLPMLLLSWQSKFSKVPAISMSRGSPSCLLPPWSKISKQAWPRVLSNWHLHWVIYTLREKSVSYSSLPSWT